MYEELGHVEEELGYVGRKYLSKFKAVWAW